MKNDGLVKNYTQEAVVPAYRIVKFGASNGAVLLAAAAADLSIGVSGRVGGDSIGERIDINRSGIAEVEYGGNVTRGQRLTSDGTGRAIAAAPGAGTNAQIIGVAEVSGVVGDIGSLLISPSVMQG